MTVGVNFETLTLPRIKYALLGLLVLFYVLQGRWLNPLIFWSAIPLFTSYQLFKIAAKPASVKRLWGALGFFTLSTLVLLLSHLAWWFDVQGTQSNAGSGIWVFSVLPVHALVFGALGYFAGTYSAKSRGVD